MNTYTRVYHPRTESDTCYIGLFPGQGSVRRGSNRIEGTEFVHVPAEAVEGSFACIVSTPGSCVTDCRPRAYKHDLAFAGAQLGEGGTDGVQQREHVDVEEFLPGIYCRIGRFGASDHHDASVEHQTIDTSASSQGGCGRGLISPTLWLARLLCTGLDGSTHTSH